MSTPHHPMPNEHYYRLLEELQTADFVLIELSLYLNTHPHDMQAIQQYNQFVQHRRGITERFEAEYGPLTHGFSKYPWQWVETPWPWQV